MTGQKFNDFLTQARLNLDPNENVIFIYDGAPAQNNLAIPGPNSELKKLPVLFESGDQKCNVTRTGGIVG